MRKQCFIWGATLITALLLLAATPAWAQSAPPNPNGGIVWNEDYIISSGERVTGDIVVFNGNASVERDGTLDGGLVIWNGDADVEGTITGDLVVSNGDIRLKDGARVDGSIVCSWNCDLDRAQDASVGGSIVDSMPLRGLRLGPTQDFSFQIPIPESPEPPGLSFWTAGPGRLFGWLLRWLRTLASILVVAVVGGLIALIWPSQVSRVGRTVTTSPLPSFGMGLLVVVAATALILGLIITICLSPVGLLGALVLAAAGLFGWVSIGTIVGTKLLQAFKAHDSAPIWAAALGTLVIGFVTMGLRGTRCLAPLSWLIDVVLVCLGLGAVALTRFGTMAYTPGGQVSHPAPADVATPEALDEPPAELDTPDWDDEG